MTPVEFAQSLNYLEFTGKKFAKYIGVARETVSRWKTGKRPIPLVVVRLVENMKAALDISLLYQMDCRE